MRRPERMIVLRSSDGLDEAFARVRRGPLAVDTETSGLDWFFDRVGAINLAAGTTTIVAVKGALGPTARYLSDQVKEGRELVFHNGKFDMHMMRETFGLHIPYPVHDTKIESFVVDNRGANAFGWTTKWPHSLKPLASIYVDPEALDPEKELMAAIRRRGGKHKGDWPILMDTEDEHLFTDYSGFDAWYTLQLHLQFIERIRHWPQPIAEDYPSLMSYYELERWVLLAFRDMEERGIQCDGNFLDEWRVELEKEKDKRVKNLIKHAGRDINWNSVPQLKEVLYGKTGLRLRGGPGTDAVSLLNLDHPIGGEMVKYREVFKQWSSYANSLRAAIKPDGAIHPTFNSTGADTGRTSCKDPNLQQQTRVSGVRRAYKPRKGLVFRFADYSQVEMRFAAHFAGEQVLIDGFKNDPDFDTHKATALKMFGKLFDPNGQHRKFAKIINFTKLFGGGEGKVTEQLINLIEEKEARAGCRAFGVNHLEPGLTWWRQLARLIITRFNTEMPHMTQAIRDEADLAEARGFVMTAFGSHRFLDDEKWYKAFNTRVQGTAGIKAKEGLVKVYRECQLNRGEIGLMLLIHDELVYESEGDPRTDRRVLELMRDDRFKVPIIADMKGSTKNWQDKESVKL